jgi:CDP-diacylglycerol--glycerol-3-phosphate 3-phosphatidyltransferase
MLVGVLLMIDTEYKNMTLTDRVRALSKHILDPIGKTLHRLGVHPDAITFLGLLVVAVACTFIAQGQFALGGIILLAGLPLDAVDGAVARAMQRQGRFGAVLDSTLDRYADGFIFIALGYYFAQQDRFEWLLIALLAGVGTQAVSYVRARADGVNLNVTIGLFTRMERVAVILVMLLVPSLLEIGVLILAIGTNFTALQRLFFVYKMLDEQGE